MKKQINKPLRLKTSMGPLWQRSVTYAKRLDTRSHGWLGMFSGAANQALSPDSSITAAAIAYFALFSLFPIALLSIAVASFTISSVMDQQLILQKLEFIAPALNQLLGKNIDAIIESRGPISGVALLGLIWSASTVFYTLTQTLNGIWNVKRRRAVWKRRGLSVLFVLSFVGPAIFLASFLSSSMATVRTWLPSLLNPIDTAISFVIAIILDIGLFMLLYVLLPHGTSTWRELIPGAIAAGLLWELAKKTFLLFVSTYISVSNLVYGSVSAIVAFLFWAYISGIIFLFGAFLSVSFHQLNQQQPESPASSPSTK
jgi:membrane protein